MTDIAVQTLRLRGPSVQRLARVAATTLPAALEAALADLPDAELARLDVRLDVDPDGYDDESLAVLWAASIRGALRTALPSAASPPANPPLSGSLAESQTAGAAPAGPAAPAPRPPAGPAAVAAAARGWSAPGPGIPALLFALAGPGVAAAVRAILGPAEWLRLVDRLRSRLGPAAAPGWQPPSGGSIGQGPGGPGPPDASSGRAETGGAAAPAGTTRAPAASAPGQDPRRGPARAPSRPAGDTGLPDPAPLVELPARLRTLAVLAAADGPSLADPLSTRTAGIVLLYPWLSDHCRAAVDLHPGLDPAVVRAAALTALVDPEDPALADDPLVVLLAGGSLRSGPPREQAVPLPHADEVNASASAILAGFCALLPGFARSSPAFTRSQWISRDGLLDTGRDPVRLTAASRPLDVVLHQLPYPLGLLRLAWSPTLAVVFR